MDKISIQDVFLKFYPEYLDEYSPSARQAKTAFHIINCKTGAYGSNISVCDSCGHVEFHHNSCRDRSCPMCQELPKEKWVDAQREDLLDTAYYHIVFTTPHELNPVFYCNQREMYGLLFRSAAETLLELAADEKYLGAVPGFISILHTWGSAMEYHPHLHLLSIGGGLAEERCWCEKKDGFFLPTEVVSSLFRGKFLAGLRELMEENGLIFEGEAAKYRNRYEFQELLDVCYKKNWVTFLKESFAGAETVMEYLGRYTHRIAISNSRIVSMDEETVTFKVRDYKNGGIWKEMTLRGVEFIRRFLMHVLPKGFVKIRHYGLLSNRNKKEKISFCRNVIGCRKYLSKLKELDHAGLMKALYDIDVNKCTCCGGRVKIHNVRSLNRILLNTA